MKSNDPEWESIEQAEPALGMKDREIFFQHHRPASFEVPYHFHPSIEINFLQGCDMTYSFSGETVEIKDGTCCIFWAAYPHKPLYVSSNGWITNAYVSLTTFMKWSLPHKFTSDILNGAVITAKRHEGVERDLVKRWASEISKATPDWQRLHTNEVKSRLNRIALEGWEIVHQHQRNGNNSHPSRQGLLYFEKMLRYAAENFAGPINIDDVARHGGVTVNQALMLFRKFLGQTIKGHITDLRIYHAKMLLSETESKILTVSLDCGYSSLSAFYEAFKQHTGLSPANYRKMAGREYFN